MTTTACEAVKSGLGCSTNDENSSAGELDCERTGPDIELLVESPFTANKYGCYVWYSNINDVANDAAIDDYLTKLTPPEKTKVTAFRIRDDQKRALLSILLQRALIRHHWGVMDSDYDIARTAENKPFPKLKSKDIGFWNYNVSHHGDFVCIASHSEHLVGVDVVDILTRSRLVKTSGEYFAMFTGQFHELELREISRPITEFDQYTRFYINWSLKEAFVKAVGNGLGYNLKDIRFEITVDQSSSDGMQGIILSGSAIVYVKDIRREDWNFRFESLDSRHVATVARGPVDDAIESYRQLAWAAGGSMMNGEQLHQSDEGCCVLSCCPAGPAHYKEENASSEQKSKIERPRAPYGSFEKLPRAVHKFVPSLLPVEKSTVQP